MAAPSQAQVGFTKFIEGAAGGLMNSRNAELAAKRQAAYLAAMGDRYAAQNQTRENIAGIAADARLGAADVYGDTRLGVADRAAAARKYAADHQKPGASIHKTTPFDLNKAHRDALMAAGWNGKDAVDYSQMDPAQVQLFNTTMAHQLGAYNTANPSMPFKTEGDALVPLTQTPATSGWLGLGAKPARSQYGPNPKWNLPAVQAQPDNAPDPNAF